MTDESTPIDHDTSPEPALLRSNGIEVDPGARELRLDGEPVTIERRAFDLLVHLMRNADRVVDKDELLREVWHSRPVSESTVAQAASRVRKALGGEPDQWVATVYGVGYRFTAPVETIETGGRSAPLAQSASSSSPFSPHRRGPSWGRRIGLPLLATALVALLVLSWTRLQTPDEETLRIAVLPVDNRTGDARLDWVELGVLPLLDRALEQGGVQRVQTSQVLSTLRRYPDAEDPAAQARVLKLNTRADRVLVPQLELADGGYRFSLRSADGTTERYDLDLQGADVAVLAVAAGTTLSESLSRWQGSERARRGLVTDDPFVNEAFARGLDARLRGRWEEAARFFDTVLAAAPDLLDAKYHLALVTRRLGDWDYTERLHRELTEEAEAQGDRGMLASVQSVSGTLAWRRGDKATAEAMYRKSLEAFAELGNEDYVANAKSNLGILAATRGEFSQAEALMGEALDHYRAVGDRFNEATALKNIGTLQVDQGRFDDAERTLLASLDIRQTLELPLEVAMTLLVIGDVEMARGQWSQALAYEQRVLDTAREYQSPNLEIQALANLSSVLRRIGRLEDAVARAAEAHARAIELGSPTNQAFALLQQGRAELDRDRAAQAASLFERARDLYLDIDQAPGAERARIALVEALIAADRFDEAEQQLQEATDRLDGSELDRLRPQIARARALLAEGRGDLQGAVNAQREAYRLTREGNAPIETVDSAGQLGLLLLGVDPGAPDIDTLVAELEPHAENSASALDFLARRLAESDPARAVQLAERRRELVGEGWTSEDQASLDELRAGLGGGPGS
ncbi:tetratricopeptide repeat protein [Halomonas denitrificans]|nr:tetratricopeptide repeat protein [Halomonas denitrificans]